ncbi:hypothetical protein EDEG_00757 [Edhazardia aedis USNM 41457]|uniref:Uncharacterized protein n=1 Tax=Edhazardia aedis (strain USNM 41457) TaxID=1003232 RepID=J9DBP5_EDHAE|nr:hypothetical protein EDEG_00757 [Edhazardia aedis USNM 41457]|eukprot:EJW05146.1 hypothetical protein EDEG_00757 [Edhazardia aedis USNM 41457]
MRLKKIANRSARKDDCLRETIGICVPFSLQTLFSNKMTDLKEKTSVCSAKERKFCKINNISFKTYMELRSTYKKKGSEALKNLARNKRVKNSKIPNILEFIKDRCNSTSNMDGIKK